MSAQNDKVEKRIKVFTLVSLLAACFAVMVGAVPMVLAGLLKLQISESQGYALAFFGVFPLMLVSTVLGILALLYHARNPLWRGGRIAIFVLSLLTLGLMTPTLVQVIAALFS